MACAAGINSMNEIGAIAFNIGTWLIPLTFAIVFHEVAHGRVALWFGDKTARDQGRLSLNPIRHVDPIGTVVLPLVLAVSGAPIFGWAKPVPVVPSRMHNPRWNMVAVAAAGPLSNIILAFITALILVAAWPVLGNAESAGLKFLTANLNNFIAINLFLALFNMLPVPPFDGSKVLGGLLPPRLGRRFARMDRYALPIMLFLLVGLPLIAPQANIIQNLVIPPFEWAYSAVLAVAGLIVGH
jgi:Zn-dependent protease